MGAILVLQYGFSSGFQVFDDYPKLNIVLAAFYEVLRMFHKPEPFFVIKLFISPSLLVASGHLLVREAAEDTVLEIPKPHDQVGTTIISDAAVRVGQVQVQQVRFRVMHAKNLNRTYKFTKIATKCN